MTSGGFILGTLVNTREGLRRIETIQVGDYVLSCPEDDSLRANYQRVLETSRHEGQRIRQLIVDGPVVGKIEMIAASDNTPFWVLDAGWLRADELDRRKTLRRSDGSACDVARQEPVYRTHEPGVGWAQSMPGSVELSHGNRYDYAKAEARPPGGFEDILPKDILHGPDPFLTTTVYGLEVEAFHTYYVGKEAVWVRQIAER